MLVKRDKGMATAVTALIITAITTVMMAAIGNTIVTMVQETMPKEALPVVVFQEGEMKKVELNNPSMVSVELNKLEVFIDGSKISISDENGDKIWSPGEKTWFLVPDKDYAVVEVYYDTRLIYTALFLRPLPLHHDNSFPMISLEKEKVGLSDDTALIALNVHVGFEDGEKLVYSTTTTDLSTAKQCYDSFRKNGSWHCHDLSTFSIDYKVTPVGETNKKVEISGTKVAEGEIHYLRFVAFDITGKSSSVILPVKLSPVIVIESITGGAKNERSSNTWIIRTNLDSVNIQINTRAVDDAGLKEIEISVSGITRSCAVSGKTATCQRDFQLSPQEYVVSATARDVSNLQSTTTAEIRILKDNPPSVVIRNPSNGDIFVSPNVQISASASDDFGLASIEIRLNNNLIQRCTVSGLSATCTCTATLSPGTNTITATAIDDIGNQASHTISVTYQAPTPTPTPTPYPTPNPYPTPTPPSRTPVAAVISVPEVQWQKILQNENVVTSP